MNDAEFIVENYKDNPVGYVMDVLGVRRLEDWQREVLESLVSVKRQAVASGHGIGKTALVTWVNHWFMATRPNPQVVVTANTKTQLESKTWRELSKWNDRALNKDWFTKTATRFYLNDAKDTWFTAAIPWSENNTEAFAGTHEDHVLVIFDEASGIPDVIWEVVEGAMTTEGARWIAFGNPTKNTGRFRECWGRFAHRWKTMQVDSREVSISDKEQIKEWVEDYGEDSDFCRVRIRGQFPRAGSNQFISSEYVDWSMSYEAEGWEYDALVFGCDIARFGDDQNCLVIRQGRKVLDILRWRGVDAMETAGRIVDKMRDLSPDLVFIDGDGVGGPVVDRVKQLMGPHSVMEINNGRTADDSSKYFNKRAEMWAKMRDALKQGIDLPEDKDLENDLIAPEYGFDSKNRIQLEKKSDMKKRGQKSPDSADALAFTFAKEVIRENTSERQNNVVHFNRRIPNSWMV
jgi:hypothetical protein